MGKIAIGQIVSFISHPYTSEQNNIIISGEYLMTPPVMIIGELIQPIIAGKKKIDKKNVKCKCIWFSNKTNQFQEDWFRSSELKVVADNTKRPSSIKLNNMIALKTLEIELGKKKSNLNVEINQTGSLKDLNSITSVLSFISPVMQCIEIKKFDEKFIKGAAKLTNHVKTFPTKMVKCKWFNPVSEKFSEKFLPIETLYNLPIVSDELINVLTKTIKEGKLLKLTHTIIKPRHISNRSGYYKLTYFDYVLNINKELDISKIGEYKMLANFFKNNAPKFNLKRVPPVTLKVLDEEINKVIVTAAGRAKKNYLRIKYKDTHGNTTVRTIKEYEIVMISDIDPTMPQIAFLQGYCYLRKALRSFRISNILEVYELNLPY